MSSWDTGGVDQRLAAIGIDAQGPAGVEQAVEQLMPNARETIYRGGGSVFEWRDPSGAGVLVTTVTVDNVVQCVTPTFTAGSLVSAIATGFGTDPACRFCEPLLLDVVDEDGHPVHAIAMHLEDSAITRRQVPLGQPLLLAVAGVVEQARTWADEDTFAATEEALPTPFPSRSVVAVGGNDRPHAMVTGVVQKAEQRVNERTGRAFWWASVDTGGTAYELVASPSTLGGLEPGNVVRAMAWMVGRVVSGLVDPPRSLFRSRAAR